MSVQSVLLVLRKIHAHTTKAGARAVILFLCAVWTIPILLGLGPVWVRIGCGTALFLHLCVVCTILSAHKAFERSRYVLDLVELALARASVSQDDSQTYQDAADRLNVAINAPPHVVKAAFAEAVFLVHPDHHAWKPNLTPDADPHASISVLKQARDLLLKPARRMPRFAYTPSKVAHLWRRQAGWNGQVYAGIFAPDPRLTQLLTALDASPWPPRRVSPKNLDAAPPSST